MRSGARTSPAAPAAGEPAPWPTIVLMLAIPKA